MHNLGQARIAALVLLLAGCTGIAPGIEPVTDFELTRYLGRWYEIARLDHPFERGLESITAEYSMRDDGGVRVLNRGYSMQDQAWEQAEGKAQFVGDNSVGHLKVSFFGPFYGSYVIFELDADYQYAFVGSYNKDYLWLLSRTPSPEREVVERFRREAQARGYAADELIYVTHDAHD